MTDQTSDSFSVAIAGVAGRMGRQLAAVSHRHGLTVAGGTEIAGSPHLDTDIGDLSGVDAGEVIDCAGLHILPGVIDSQVHFREPGAEAKEALVCKALDNSVSVDWCQKTCSDGHHCPKACACGDAASDANVMMREAR